MSFTYDVSTDRGKTRLLIADTASTSYVFEDDEIDAFITLGGEVLLAAAMALRSLAADKAKFAIYYVLNGFTMDRREVTKRLLEIADKLESSAEGVPFEYESVLEGFIDSMGQDRSNYMDSI